MGLASSIEIDPRLIEIINRINEIDPILAEYNKKCEAKELERKINDEKIQKIVNKLLELDETPGVQTEYYINLYSEKHDLLNEGINYRCPPQPLSDKMVDQYGNPITLQQELVYLMNEKATLDPYNKHKSLRRQRLGGKRKSRKNCTKKCKKCKCLHNGKCKKSRKSRKKGGVVISSKEKQAFPTPMRPFLKEATIVSPSKNPFPEVKYSISDINKKHFSPGSRINLYMDPYDVDPNYKAKRDFMEKQRSLLRSALEKKGKQYTPEREIMEQKMKHARVEAMQKEKLGLPPKFPDLNDLGNNLPGGRKSIKRKLKRKKHRKTNKRK